MPLRHAAPSPPQLPDSLHRLAKKQSRLPPDFLSGHAYQDGKGERRGDFTQEADLVRGICGGHGGYDTAEVRGIRRSVGRRGLREGAGKIVDCCFLEALRAFEISAEQWTNAAQDEGKWRRTAKQGAELYNGKMDRCR